MSTITDPTTLTTGQITQAVLAAGQLDTLTGRAAAYLVAHTELPGRRDFTRHLTLTQEPDTESGATVLAAYVDWSWLSAALPRMRLGGGDERLAVSYAAGVPVDLREASVGHGSVHIRHVIQAAIIATGAEDTELYNLTDGPGLDRIRAFKHRLAVSNDGENR